MEFMDTPMAGRTHGKHAEPTTFGAKLALWCLQADRDRERLRAARDMVAVGKLSGAVGTFSNIDPAVEAFVCAALGLVPVPATQVIARDRHAELLWACASVGATIEMIGTRSVTWPGPRWARWRKPSRRWRRRKKSSTLWSPIRRPS